MGAIRRSSAEPYLSRFFRFRSDDIVFIKGIHIGNPFRSNTETGAITGRTLLVTINQTLNYFLSAHAMFPKHIK